MRTLIVIPAYNEEANIASTIESIREAISDVDIVVVDDGSTDETPALAREQGATVLSLPFNLGYGAALQTGFRYAQMKDYDEVVQIDADGQHEPDCIPDLLNELRKGDVDVVIGSRFLGQGVYRPPLLRRLGMWVMRRLIRIATGKTMTDPTSGYQALGPWAIALYASEVYPVDYPDADVLIMITRMGLKVREVPVRMYQQQDGKSMHSSLKPVWYMFKMLLSILVTMLRSAPKTSRG